MAGEIPFVGICPGPDEENPILNDPGYPKITIEGSTVVFNGCNHLVNGRQCNALQPQDQQSGEAYSPDELPNCRAITILFSQGSEVRVDEEGKEDDSPIKTILTKAGQLSVNLELDEIVRSPFLPEGHEPVPLTTSESRFIGDLMRHQGNVRSRGQLYAAMNDGEKLFGDSRTVDAIKKRLSGKLGEVRREKKVIIETIREGGYVIRNASPQRG